MQGAQPAAVVTWTAWREFKNGTRAVHRDVKPGDVFVCRAVYFETGGGPVGRGRPKFGDLPDKASSKLNKLVPRKKAPKQRKEKQADTKREEEDKEVKCVDRLLEIVRKWSQTQSAVEQAEAIVRQALEVLYQEHPASEHEDLPFAYVIKACKEALFKPGVTGDRRVPLRDFFQYLDRDSIAADAKTGFKAVLQGFTSKTLAAVPAESAAFFRGYAKQVKGQLVFEKGRYDKDEAKKKQEEEKAAAAAGSSCSSPAKRKRQQ